MQKQSSTSAHNNSPFKTPRRYEQPTISSKSRSPSPYTNRRMCELSEDSKQRLPHLHLGPYEFRKETENKPPFVVRHLETNHIPDTSMMSCSMRTSLSMRDSSRVQNGKPCAIKEIIEGLLLENHAHKPSTPRKLEGSSRMHIDDLDLSLDSLNESEYQETECDTGSPYRASFTRSAPLSVQRHPPSPVLTRSSLTERFQSDHQDSVNWKEIHSRVKSILRTHSARQKLHFEKDDSWKEPYSDKRRTRTSPSEKELQDRIPYTQDRSIHLDNGEFWCNKASTYKGKSHRVIFEESMEKIYKNMYRNASNSHTHKRSHNS